MHRTVRPFELFEPQTIEEAVRILSTYGDKARVLAGGVDLVAKMRRWQMKPECVVSIRKIPGLDYVKGNRMNGLRIGALATLLSVELSAGVQKDFPILYEAIHQIASIQVKSMGTVVGNLCAGTPASDVVPVLFVLGAELKIVGPRSERNAPIGNFFVGVGQTCLRPDEMVTEISVPSVPARSGGAFMKLAHTAACIAKVNVATMITADNGICKEARIALGAVAPTVIKARKAEQTIKGQKPEPKIIEEAAKTASGEATPITDLRSTAEYRRQMVRVLVKHAIERAFEKAKA